jgi:hypothetical protein
MLQLCVDRFFYFQRVSFDWITLSVVVSVPAALRQFTHDKLEVGLDASTVEELILKLDDLFPGLNIHLR